MYFIKLTLSTDQTKILEFQGSFQKLSFSSRFWNAAKKAGLFFFLAVLFVPVPGAHFVMVPLFIILSIFNFFKVFFCKETLVIKGLLPCLHCNQELALPKYFSEDKRIRCSHCFQHHLINHIR